MTTLTLADVSFLAAAANGEAALIPVDTDSWDMTSVQGGNGWYAGFFAGTPINADVGVSNTATFSTVNMTSTPPNNWGGHWSYNTPVVNPDFGYIAYPGDTGDGSGTSKNSAVRKYVVPEGYGGPTRIRWQASGDSGGYCALGIFVNNTKVAGYVPLAHAGVTVTVDVDLAPGDVVFFEQNARNVADSQGMYVTELSLRPVP